MPIMPCRRLLTALSISLLLHFFAVGGFDAWTRLRQNQQRNVAASITVTLADQPDVRANDAETLLKDTLAKEEGQRRNAATPAIGNGWRSIRREEIARRKLAGHLFYPPAAVARGLEGEVRLLLSLDVAGNIADVQIASSSGYPLLDQAAIDAAHAMGRLGDAGVHEMILPVNFSLQ